MKTGPKPLWWHGVAALILAALCGVIWGLSLLTRWLFPEPWGTVAFIVVMVVGWAFWSWWLDPGRAQRRRAAS